MQAGDAPKVLIVDDSQDKLLVYRSVLEESGFEVVAATCGAEALKLLLHDEFAVILLDVNMPGIDGFETAALIRARKKCAHIPIIFVTAHTDEMHAMRGYAYGAVDYMFTPIAPEVLRTKVGVFVELFRKTQQVRQQAEALRELQAREHRRQLRESHERLELALQAGNLSACEWEGGERLVSWSPSLGTAFGFEPGQFGGAVAELESRLHPEDRGSVTDALRDAFRVGGEFRIEHRIVRPDGRVAWLELRGRVFPGEGSAPPRMVGVCSDITAARIAQETRSRLAAIVDSTDDAVIGKTLDGIITSFNPAAERLFGYPAAEIVGKPVELLVPPERLDEERDLRQRLARGERRHFETVRRDRSGRCIDITLTVSPVLGPDGRIVGGSSIARDIGDRKRAEQEIRRYGEHLEQLVRERTAELEASHRRLRLADHLASMGTLAAGLGHDMGNLLLAMRIRLDALETLSLSDESREDLRAIASAIEYLKRLSNGMRMFALDPEDMRGSPPSTDLASWWEDAYPFLRGILPREVTISQEIHPGVPPLLIPPHLLTQVVYNLVQNARDALRDSPAGRVVIAAHPREGSDEVVISVNDNGPGMDEETRRRCLEPFFTTKTRGISTGLGLSLVCGVLRKVNGSIEIDSVPGAGTTFRLNVPTVRAEPCEPDRIDRTGEQGGVACIDLDDPRMRAFVTMVLRSQGTEAVVGGWPARSGSSLAVLRHSAAREEQALAYLSEDPTRVAILIGGEPSAVEQDRLIRLPGTPATSELRAALLLAVRHIRATPASDAAAR